MPPTTDGGSWPKGGGFDREVTNHRQHILKGTITARYSTPNGVRPSIKASLSDDAAGAFLCGHCRGHGSSANVRPAIGGTGQVIRYFGRRHWSTGSSHGHTLGHHCTVSRTRIRHLREANNAFNWLYGDDIGGSRLGYRVELSFLTGVPSIDGDQRWDGSSQLLHDYN